MRKVICYIAMSLDGYIADENGRVDWLNDESIQDDSYESFIAGVDTILMGRNTYDQIVHELAADIWPYEQPCYILTHHPCQDHDKIYFWNEDPRLLIRQLKQAPGKAIWVCGGANLIHQLHEDIDEYQLAVMPCVLGEGISLFQNVQAKLCLKNIRTHQQIIYATYVRKRES